MAQLFAIDEHDRQALGTFTLHEIQDAGVRDEWLRILGEVVASDRHAPSGKPIDVGGERRKQRVDTWATDPARTTHGRIEDIDMSHMSNPSYTASSNALSRFNADGTMQ